MHSATKPGPSRELSLLAGTDLICRTTGMTLRKDVWCLCCQHHLLMLILLLSDATDVPHTSNERFDTTSTIPLQLWSDATWAPDYGNFYDNYRSTTGWCSTAFDNLLSWSSHRQTVVAQSTPESEWHAAADAAKEAAYIKNLFYELGIDCPRNSLWNVTINPL